MSTFPQPSRCEACGYIDRFGHKVSTVLVIINDRCISGKDPWQICVGEERGLGDSSQMVFRSLRILFIHSFIPYVFVECLLCVRQCSRHWGYRSEQKIKKKKFLP